MQIKTKLKHSQLARYLLSNDIDIPNSISKEIINKEIIINISNQNSVKDKIISDEPLTILNPSSVSKFLFNAIYHSINKYIIDDFQKDKLSILLVETINLYIDNDYLIKEHDQIPVVLDYDKLTIPSFIIREIVQPIIGEAVKIPKLLFMHCKFTDAARIITDTEEIHKLYDSNSNVIKYDDYPIILVNYNINNQSSILSDVLIKCLQINFGEDKTINILRKIILNKDDNVMEYIISTIKILSGDPGFIVDFLGYIESNVFTNDEDHSLVMSIFNKHVQNDNYLSKNIKTGYATYTPQLQNQWSQWSMLMGLLEKQLEPMRGSMWPATENLGPIEKRRSKMISDAKDKKHKKNLNIEELLEIAREMYNHKAIEPGKLYERLLQQVRVWK